MANFYFYSPVAFEPWDWRNSVEKGIGGSETSHVEMAWRLARHGHAVTTYAPIPEDCPGEWRGTIWKPLEAVDWSQPGIWVLYRCPDAIDHFLSDVELTLPSDAVLAFDWGGTLERSERVRQIARAALRQGLTCHLVPALGPVDKSDADVEADYHAALQAHSIDMPVHRVLWAPDKKDVLASLGVTHFWDDLEQNILDARSIHSRVQAFHVPHQWGNDQITALPQRTGQQVWFLMQDYDYPGWTPERKARMDRVITLCQAHGRDVEIWHPDLVGKVWLSSNGVKVDLLDEIAAEPIVRNPHRIVFASSPDRGVLNLIDIFTRAREVVRDLELHITYGLDNAKKLPGLKKTVEAIETKLQAPGVTWHGRMTQPELYRLERSAGIWCYPTTFRETSCITSMENQALGAIPVVSPVYALADNVRHGIFIEGDPADPLVRARFAAEIVRVATDESLQAKIRGAMMREARTIFDWEKFVDQWECAAEGRSYPHAFPVQLPSATAPDETSSSVVVPVPSVPALVASRPKISVLTASIRTDRLGLTKATLDAQTERDFEWLVCSPDRFEDGAQWIPDPGAGAAYCSLMKAWNRLCAAATGDVLVFLSDLTAMEPDALAWIWSQYQQHPKRGLSAWHLQFANDQWQQVTWLDYRLPDLNTMIVPGKMEFRCAAIPKAMVEAVSGFDEAFDDHPAMGEKDVCQRALAHGYEFFLAGHLFARFAVHEPYDKRYDAGLTYYARKHGLAS